MKKEKIYLPFLFKKFLLETKEGFHCFGCGKDISSEDPMFTISTSEEDKHLCLNCAVLAKKKDKQEIRELEFEENSMAGIHQKNLKNFKRLILQYNLGDVMVDIFPEFSKVSLLPDRFFGN